MPGCPSSASIASGGSPSEKLTEICAFETGSPQSFANWTSKYTGQFAGEVKPVPRPEWVMASFDGTHPAAAFCFVLVEDATGGTTSVTFVDRREPPMETSISPV